MTPSERYQAYLAYLAVKIEERDWHGVADAANDLRELEATHPEVGKETDEDKLFRIKREMEK